jgi:hypothetical protein
MDRVLRTALESNTLEGLADLLRDAVTGLHKRDGFLTLGTRMLESARGAKLTALFDGIPILYTSGYSQDSEGLAPAGVDARYPQKPAAPPPLAGLYAKSWIKRSEGRKLSCPGSRRAE